MGLSGVKEENLSEGFVIGTRIMTHIHLVAHCVKNCFENVLQVTVCSCTRQKEVGVGGVRGEKLFS